MARKKFELDPDEIPWLLQQWLDKRRSSVVVVEHGDASRHVIVTWFNSEDQHRTHVGQAGVGAAAVALDAWDAGNVEEQGIFRSTFPTWYANLMKDPMTEVMEAFREQGAACDASESSD